MSATPSGTAPGTDAYNQMNSVGYYYSPLPGQQYGYQSSLGYQQNQYTLEQQQQDAAAQAQLQQQQAASNQAAQAQAEAAARAQQQAQIDAANQQQAAQLEYQRQQDAQNQANFNTVYGNLTQQQAAFANQPANPYGTQPRITGGPIWTQQGIQQNLNAQRASTARSTETQVQNQRGQLSGMGFGARSPLMAALENQTRMGGTATNADYTRSFTQNARQQNAQHNLDTQTQQEQQFANRNQEYNQRYNTNAQQQSSLYAALANLV